MTITTGRPTVTFDTTRYEAFYCESPRGTQWWTFEIAGNTHTTPHHMTFAQARRWFIANEAGMYSALGDEITVEVLP